MLLCIICILFENRVRIELDLVDFGWVLRACIFIKFLGEVEFSFKVYIWYSKDLSFIK